MGSTPSKKSKNITKKKEKFLQRKQSKAGSNSTPDQQNKNQQHLHSNTVTLTNDSENDNNATEQERKWGKTNSREKYGIDDPDKRNDNDEIKKEQADRNDRTEENTDSGAVGVEDGLTIALPQQSAERLDIDKRSPNQIIKDEKAREDKERAIKEEKEKQEKEDKEKAKKRKQSLKASLREKVSSLQKQYEDSDMKCSLLDKAVLRLMHASQQKKESSNTELFALDKDKQKQIKLKTVKDEKAILLHRLSEIASARLRHNNPDIADLSDENRATKLAEKLSELYDNEWTDLFEATKTKAGKTVNERAIAESLRDILKFCYEKCQCIANNQLVSLFSCLHMVVDPVDLQSSPPELRLRLKEFQKHISRYSVQHIQTSVSKAVAKSTNNELKENVVVKCSLKTKQYNLYINLCTEITWHMQIQDPPVVLDFGTDSADISRFRPYTASGPLLDYVLWPAMLLHNNGPIVAKGVAQFKKKQETNETISEKDDKQSTETNAKHDQTAHAEW